MGGRREGILSLLSDPRSGGFATGASRGLSVLPPGASTGGEGRCTPDVENLALEMANPSSLPSKAVLRTHTSLLQPF